MSDISIANLNTRTASRTFDESTHHMSTFRDRRPLDREMSEIAQELAAENSHTIKNLM
jgi:hypothetical protein